MTSSSKNDNVYTGYPYEEDDPSLKPTTSPDEATQQPLKQIGGPKRPGRRAGSGEPQKKF